MNDDATDSGTEGAWIFLSHSHQDLEKVRPVRNHLEALGHNPLMFFLKCMGDESELDGLIRREIEARTWFLLCDSENARASRWVQAEVEMIKTLDGKVYETVDLSRGIEDQIERITALSRRATVFMTYRRNDGQDVAFRIAAALRAADFRLFDMDYIQPGVAFTVAISSGIEQALEHGFVLWLIGAETLDADVPSDNDFVVFEMRTALERQAALGKANIVPVLIRDAAGPMRNAVLARLVKVVPGAASIQVATLNENSFDDDIAQLVDDLKNRPI